MVLPFSVTKTWIALLLALAVLPLCNGKAQSLSEDDKASVKKFISGIKHKRPDVIAANMAFPFRRNYPIPEVEDSAEFVRRFDQIFDKELIKTIAKSKAEKDWHRVGWRGIIFLNGVIWLDESGGLLAVNVTTKREADVCEQLVQAEKAGLHPSMRNFYKPKCSVETKDLRIRIDLLQNQSLRFASWKKEAAIDSQPDLVLYDGEDRMDGNRGDHFYRFKTIDSEYTIYIFRSLREDESQGQFVIYKGGQEESSELTMVKGD